MKTRLGFVSNSSSSSFLVGVPLDRNEEFTHADIRELFGIVPDSLVDRLIGADLVRMVLKNERTMEYELDNYGCETFEEFVEENLSRDGDEVKRSLYEGLNAGRLRLFKLSGSNESDTPLEAMLYYVGLEPQITKTGVHLVSEY